MGKVHDLQGDSKPLRDSAVRAALSPAHGFSLSLGLWGESHAQSLGWVPWTATGT